MPSLPYSGSLVAYPSPLYSGARSPPSGQGDSHGPPPLYSGGLGGRGPRRRPIECSRCKIRETTALDKALEG